MSLNSSRPGSNPTMPYPFWMRGNTQLGLNQRVNHPTTKQRSWVNVHPRETPHVAPPLPPPPPIVTNVKASDLLKEQLLRVPALARVLGGTWSRTTAGAQPAPPLRPRLHRFLDDFGTEATQKSTPQKPSEAATVINKEKEEAEKKKESEKKKEAEAEKKYDGRIHSNPHKKNGPYTCPKCKGVFETSQRFASHVSSIHYKFESKIERKKRLMARYYKRNPRVEWVNGKPTIVWGNSKNTSVIAPPPPQAPPPRVLVPKTECVVEELLPPPPGFGKPIPPPPGFEKVNYAIPGFHLPFGFHHPFPFGFHQKLPVAAPPRGVQIKLEIQ